MNSLVATVLICIIVIVGFITLVFFIANMDSGEQDFVCKEIGSRKNLTFLFHSRGKCGWGIDCLYQCRFVNNNGDIIIQNVN